MCTKELCHERVGGLARQRCISAKLEKVPLVDHGDLVTDTRGLPDVVGHHHERLPERVDDAEEVVLEPRRGDRVERREGLVEEEELRIEHQRTNEPHSLALPPAQLKRVAIKELRRDADEAAEIQQALLSSCGGPAKMLRHERRPVPYFEVWEEPSLLDDVPHPKAKTRARRPREPLSENVHFSARR